MTSQVALRGVTRKLGSMIVRYCCGRDVRTTVGQHRRRPSVAVHVLRGPADPLAQRLRLGWDPVHPEVLWPSVDGARVMDERLLGDLPGDLSLDSGAV